MRHRPRPGQGGRSGGVAPRTPRCSAPPLIPTAGQQGEHGECQRPPAGHHGPPFPCYRRWAAIGLFGGRPRTRDLRGPTRNTLRTHAVITRTISPVPVVPSGRAAGTALPPVLLYPVIVVAPPEQAAARSGRAFPFVSAPL